MMPHIGVTSQKNTANSIKPPQNHKRQWLRNPQKQTPGDNSYDSEIKFTSSNFSSTALSKLPKHQTERGHAYKPKNCHSREERNTAAAAASCKKQEPTAKKNTRKAITEAKNSTDSNSTKNTPLCIKKQSNGYSFHPYRRKHSSGHHTHS